MDAWLGLAGLLAFGGGVVYGLVKWDNNRKAQAEAVVGDLLPSRAPYLADLERRRLKFETARLAATDALMALRNLTDPKSMKQEEVAEYLKTCAVALVKCAIELIPMMDTVNAELPGAFNMNRSGRMPENDWHEISGFKNWVQQHINKLEADAQSFQPGFAVTMFQRARAILNHAEELQKREQECKDAQEKAQADEARRKQDAEDAKVAADKAAAELMEEEARLDGSGAGAGAGTGAGSGKVRRRRRE